MRSLAIWVVLAAAPAYAEDRVSARQHFEEGTKAFDLGLYDKAVNEYMAAYQAKSDPALLYNIAQAHRLGSHPREAYRFYRVYLQRLPNAPNRVEVEHKMAELKITIDKLDKTQSEMPPDVTLPPKPDTKEPAAAPPSSPSTMPANEPAAATAERAPEAPRPGRTRRIVGLTLGAVGVGATAVGIAFGVLAQNASSSLSSTSHMGGVYDPSTYSSGKNDQIVEGVMLGVGLAAIGSGVVLYVLGHREGKAATVVSWR